MSSSAKQFQSEVFKQQALESSDSHPVFLTLVEINGGHNILRQFFSKLLSPLIEKSDYTLDQLVSKVNQSSDFLEKAEIFEKIKPSLHVDYTHSFPEMKSYNKDKPIVTKVVYDLETKELSEGNLALGFNNEDFLTVDLGYINNNFNHNAEQVNIGVNYQPYKPSERLESILKLETKLRNPAYKFILDLHNSHQNNQIWQQNSSKATGGLIGILFLNRKKGISVFNGFSLIKRSIDDFSDQKNDSLLSFIGENYKSSMISKISYDNTVVSNGFLSEGFKFSMNNQISSDQARESLRDIQIGFMKTTCSFDWFKSSSNNMFTTHFFKEMGAIFSAHPSKLFHVSDKFYLGGFHSFRGFSRNGVNEHGGTQYYKAGVTVFGHMPNILHPGLNPRNNPMRIYVTGMAGNVSNSILKESGVFSLGFGMKYVKQLVELDVGYYVSRRADFSNTYGVRDGFKLQMSLGGVGGSS
ncbi:hypothetical protein METBIDRAFT_40018 [Metschnikowia bicuspidata var. bicuspidata NRRL YB-4993]|uniref:Uncharacterized protein n=1 Tax=Metschnikowia bicuspidata var. bicuspidata NRRL YB-4993 TaxID=869754 RepID=A0A1A0HE67_9ASCO|nr:hypothetical protein METBIDRAFT_40018 [Metschnikowia bicuspidata var. bicuspidata NRRL YB-4993]OBA22198.1 hypothetical protein METBIDRAFT_40018 [Metschnikowia bicuspidata var. bicuspidata NRRL YB-4993]